MQNSLGPPGRSGFVQQLLTPTERQSAHRAHKENAALAARLAAALV